jgi:hypothetical protein
MGMFTARQTKAEADSLSRFLVMYVYFDKYTHITNQALCNDIDQSS